MEAQLGTIIKVAPVFEVPAVGFSGNDFLNSCVLIHSDSGPKETLAILQKIEKIMGRQPKAGMAYENRIIDLDILLFDDLIIDESELQIPHPRMVERDFVMKPLNSIAGDVFHPVLNKTIESLSFSNELSEVVEHSGISLQRRPLKSIYINFEDDKKVNKDVDRNILQTPDLNLSDREELLKLQNDNTIPSYTEIAGIKLPKNKQEVSLDHGNKIWSIIEIKAAILKLNFIAIEGNIGSGKTSLANKISEDFNGKCVLERFAENPFLPLFYEDKERYSFPLEMSFLADRYQQLSDDVAQHDLFTNFTVADYYVIKSLIFSKITLEEQEYALYQRLFNMMYKELVKPDLYVYLYQNEERLLENIKKRGREYEQNIEADYLSQIQQGYADFIRSQNDLKIKVIDVTDLDFVNSQEDYLKVLQQIAEAIAAD